MTAKGRILAAWVGYWLVHLDLGRCVGREGIRTSNSEKFWIIPVTLICVIYLVALGMEQNYTCRSPWGVIPQLVAC